MMIWWILAATAVTPPWQEDPTLELPHVVVVLIDDAGPDMVQAYAQHDSAPPTPNLDQLAREGMLFTAAFAQPSCAPSRASLLTGLNPYRTGIGQVGKHDAVAIPEDNLDIDTPNMARMLADTHRTVAIGKWHLARHELMPMHPLQFGFARFWGTRGNVPSSYRWLKYGDRRPRMETQWSTTDLVDQTLAELRDAAEPVFLYLALHEIHGPFELPPAGFYTPGPMETKAQIVRAEMEAVDRELGRLFDGVPDNTLLVVLGDNGTEKEVMLPPFLSTHGKGSVHDTGTLVPMIVRGPGVIEGESHDLVHLVDVLPTVADYLGVDAPQTDGVSFVDVLSGGEGSRDHVYVERFSPNGRGRPEIWFRAAREERYKLVDARGRHLLYDLGTDPKEQKNLLRRTSLSRQHKAAYARLAAILNANGDYPPIPPLSE